VELKVIDLGEDLSGKLFTSPDCLQLIRMYQDYYLKIGFHVPWVGYFVLRENEVVGSCGFTGPPKDGRAEIAYWTFPQFEGQGIAGFSCRELIAIAKLAMPTVIITAKTAPEHNASTKILQKNGFTFSEVVQDEEIGDAWLWVHGN
jgi:ribosomal-protein-alanine N-acetyltransferase